MSDLPPTPEIPSLKVLLFDLHTQATILLQTYENIILQLSDHVEQISKKIPPPSPSLDSD